jgi:hypothetical protein
MRSVAGNNAHMPYMRATVPRSHRFVNYLMAVNFRSICFLYLSGCASAHHSFDAAVRI